MERIILLLLFAALAESHSCRTCVRSNCVEPTNCVGGVTRDACRCCLVCAKQLGQNCGGWYNMEGSCDVGLKCVISGQKIPTGQEIGTCRKVGPESEHESCREEEFEGCNVIGGKCKCTVTRACSNPFRFPDQSRCSKHIISFAKSNCSQSKCAVAFTPKCTPDSELGPSVWPPGECCPSPPKCRCKKNVCKPRICPTDYIRILLRPANGKPGSCCRRYACAPRKPDCSDVTCPVFEQEILCPNDSFRVASRRSGCCDLPPKCRCKACAGSGPCPSGSRAFLLSRGDNRPGSCCDVTECVVGSCRDGADVHKEGDAWRRGPCVTCRCVGGVRRCVSEECRATNCAKTYTPHGQCCPRCNITIHDPPTTNHMKRICTDYAGEIHMPGEVWLSDPCTRCVCEEDGPRCVASSCQKTCEKPRHVPGKCCGVCDEPTVIEIPTSPCNLTLKECPFGLKSKCECLKKSELCKELTDCKLRCPAGRQTDKHGCELCLCKKEECDCDKQCPFGFRGKRCPRCKCRRCAVTTNCRKKCKFGRTVNSFGCKICKCRSEPQFSTKISPKAVSCSDENKQRDDGEVWTTANGRQCTCRREQILCEMMECPRPTCDEPVFTKDFPCPVCPSDSKVELNRLRCVGRVDGESWQADSCTTCVCVSARVFCSFQVCDPTPCKRPTFNDKHCCPVCQPNDFQKSLSESIATPRKCTEASGGSRDSGSSWKVDKCTSCSCLDGEIRCFRKKCLRDTSCNNPVLKRGECCPQCFEEPFECRVGSRNLTDGQSWFANGCNVCSCVRGVAVCRTEIKPDCQGICEVCDDTATSEKSASQSLVPIAITAGVAVLLTLIGFAAFTGYKKRKIVAKSAIYKAGNIKKNAKT